MAEERVQRRLAAILAADMVGYSRLMGADEEGTIARQKAHRAELIDPEFANHGGRIVKTTGDGLLVEFGSVVDAVRCAVAIQQAMTEREVDVPDDRLIQYRVGINLGDIVIDGDDILGDGVNIAARLEGLAAPGGVCVSAKVFEEIGNKLDLAFEDIGPQEVKNIAAPVRAYRVTLDRVSTAPVPAESPPPRDKPSIAVLPFDNMSGDPEQEFFSDGLAEDIITALSKIERMRVIARNSTFAYKGQALDLRRIAEELGVRYVLEGSVRRGGNRLRITAQLIDAEDGSHLWAERYDRPVDDLFDIQDEITKEIVTALQVKLTDGEEALVWARGTNNIEAWQYAVRALDIFIRLTPTSHLEARELAEKATELDSDYAHAWAIQGFTYWWDGRFDFTGDRDAKFARASELAERATALDDSVSWVIGLNAMVAPALGHPDVGVAVARRGIELYPGNAAVRNFLAYALMHAGNFLEAAEHSRAVNSLDPFPPIFYRNVLARSLMFLGEFDEALILSDEILEIEPNYLQVWLNRAYIYGQLDREAEACDAISAVRQLAPNMRVSHVPWILMIDDEAATNSFMDGL
ncbi:MAG: adenylate/guanylate cyclase domain-containing protein [Alphaproteobacteria bacterium]|nr:adenylate/guanylate cyclase domain-containing protein [Alphaproteobacteria bacterium]